MTRARLAVGIASVVACVLVIASPVHAAFPGANGKLLFITNRDSVDPYNCGDQVSGPCVWELDTMDGDGSNVTPLKVVDSSFSWTTWSPDGTKIAYASSRDGNSDVYTMNADGTGDTKITSDLAVDYAPAWSPDGTKIVFATNRDGNSEIYTMNADGTNATRLTTNPTNDQAPSWSPDGTKIVFQSHRLNNTDIYVMNADGTNQTRLTTPQTQDALPSWSPDGSKIVFVSERDSNASGRFNQIYTMNADGSDQTRITDDTVSNWGGPRWSPDGTKIGLTGASFNVGERGEIYTIDPDGTHLTRLTNNNAEDGVADWQPIPVNGYPRPKGATPFQTYLALAYKPCTSPNEQHGSPLAVLSCSPPQQASDFLTVGTLDANGQAAKAVGSVRYDVKPGTAVNPADDADVKINVSIKDVRMKSDLSDYAGELGVSSSRRITDKDNTPAPDGTTGAATTQDTPLSITVPCAPTTADDTIGSLCSISTTADAIVAGQVKEEMRSNWELGQVKVYDGGADADADTTADNTLFMDEGIFVP